MHRPAVRRALDFVLAAFDQLQVIAQVSTSREAIALCAACRPDVALVDGSNPDLELGTACPHVRVLVLSIFSESDSMPHNLLGRVSHYLNEQTCIDELARAICQAVPSHR